MKAKIIKIDQGKMSRNRDQIFYRVKFLLEDGSFAMTDLVPAYRNFAWWKPAVEKGVGTWVGGIFMKGKNKIDADSQVFITQEPLIPQNNQLGMEFADVRSHTDPNSKYKIAKTDMGWECSCPAFIYSKSIPKTCKHLAEFFSQGGGK